MKAKISGIPFDETKKEAEINALEFDGVTTE
jgi:hypothetical protein